MENIHLGAFISITYRSHFVWVNNKVKEFGLSAGQFFVLFVLLHEQGVTQDTLAWKLLIDKGSIARALNVLEDKDFVKRITDENNRRAVRIYLTEKGESFLPTLSRISQEMEEVLLSGLTEEEMIQARMLLCKIAQNSYEAAYDKDDKKLKEFPLKDF